MFSRKKDPSLAKIILAIVLVGGLAFGGYTLARRFYSEHVTRSVTGKAPQDIQAARDALSAGQYDQARALLEPVALRADDSALAGEALVLLADAAQSAGDKQRALSYLQHAIEQAPEGPVWTDAAGKCARLMDELGMGADARGVYERLRDSSSPSGRASGLVGLGERAMRDGDVVAARDLFRQAIGEAPFDSEVWQFALDGFGEANVALVFSSKETPDSQIYEVRKGDSLTRIGSHLNTTQGMLMRANNLADAGSLRVGQRLLYTPKEFRIVIERSTCRLFLLDEDGLFKCYRVGLGKEGHESTLGSYKLGDKEKDPAWWKPGEGRIPPGDPRNELGTRWMPLVPLEDGLPKDLGIHGALDPSTVGAYTSLGCARMTKEDVEELYDLVVRSTPVDLVDVYDVDQVR